MCRKFRFSATLSSAILALALVMQWPSAALARPFLANAIATGRDDEAANPVTAPLAEQLSEARMQLRQAIQSREGEGEGDGDRGPGQHRHALLADKQRLLDWLVDLQGEKVKRLEELDALRAKATVAAEADRLGRALQGPPPYSAVEVDALRDEIDGLVEKLAAAEASYRANQTELQNLNAELKVRAAARRAGTTLGARSVAETEKAQGQRDIARLLERTAEVEISLTAIDQQRLTTQIAALRGRVEDMKAVVAGVLPHQQISQENLAAERQRVRGEERRLTEEIEHIGRRATEHRAERDKLSGEGNPSNQRAALLDLAIKTDNAVLKGLDHLQMINGISGDAWDKRTILLSNADPDQRRVALNALNELRQKLADWRSLSRTRQDALSTEIREQRIQVDGLAAGDPERNAKAERVALLMQQTAIGERVELAATHLERQVGRWLRDVDQSNGAPFGVRLTRLADRGRNLLTSVWQQELFTVEDVSELDGRKVSIKYGVTVGKSVGILVVLIAGYWLLVRLSGFVHRQLVRRLKLSEQFASVVQRWSMIVLAIALVVFALNLAHIPLSVFAFLGGTLAIGVGFGAQTVIKNFISGLIMLFERKVRVGDIVELGGVTGHVIAVDLRATTVLGFNGVEALIPNASFVESQVVNWTHSNRQMRHELRLHIAYGSNVRHAESLMLAAAAEHPGVLDDPAPEAFFESLGDSALTVALVYWVELEDMVAPRRIASDLRHDIVARFDQAGIAIPFPQHEVRLSLVQPVPARAALPRELEAIHAS